MANTLLIRFHTLRPGMDPDLVSWVMYDQNRQGTQVQQGSLDEVTEHAAGNRVIVIVPGDDVLLSKCAIPTQNRKRLLTALPYALEDQLVSDVDAMHFAVGDRDDNGDIACAIVSRDIMSTWVERLNQFGIQANYILPDILALPLIENAWTLLLDENEVILRTGKQSGLTMEADQAMNYLHMLINESGDKASTPEQFIVYKTDSAMQSDLDLSVFGLPVTEDIVSNGLLPFVHGVTHDEAINLLQGEFSRKEQIGKIWRPWLPAAAMLAALLLLQLVVTTSEYFQLKSQSKALRAEIVQTYREAFPEAKNIVDPRVQMERKLRALRGGDGGDGDGVLGLLNGTAPVLTATSGLVIKSVRYNEGKLDVDLVINDYQSLDKLKLDLIKQGGVSVDIVSANSRDNKVESRLKIQGAAS